MINIKQYFLELLKEGMSRDYEYGLFNVILPPLKRSVRLDIQCLLKLLRFPQWLLLAPIRHQYYTSIVIRFIAVLILIILESIPFFLISL